MPSGEYSVEKATNQIMKCSCPAASVAELVARGLKGFVENGVDIRRITQTLRLPAFEYSAHNPFAWPR
jgi:hypothetical protein